jgi:mannose-6-phosphate isomerase-like protein (cupin superfamily)
MEDLAKTHRRPLRTLAMACLALALTSGAPLAGEPAKAPPRGAEVTPAAHLRAMVTKTVEGLVTHAAVDDPAARTLVVRRDRPGQVEVHDMLNDVVVVQAGAATLLAGGRADGARETAAGEWRGGTIVGGERRRLGPGDVAWIPAGVPHLLIVERGGSFTYVVVKTTKAP